jgi:hypothetical protein
MILNSRTKFQGSSILGDKTNFQKYSNSDRICELSDIILYHSDIEIGLVKSLVILLPNLSPLVIPL